MRSGTNPNRNSRVNGYKPIVLSAICHLPDMTGYHEQRFDVIQVCLETMRANAGDHNFGVLVWDNGSCDEFRHWLMKIFKPDHLILSNNVGKASARAGILRMLPPATIVNISDDDMFYYPGWLDMSLDILNHFPSVGQVSGYPVRTQFRWGNRRTIQWAQGHAKLEAGKYILEKWDRDFCASIGRDYEFQKQYTLNDYDLRITYAGKQAFAVAHHCQFICQAGKLSPFAIWDQDAMGDEKPFDTAVDEAGLLRLTTTQRLTRHIGNVLDEDIIEMCAKLREEVLA